jgi:PPK2 family polyphosphate:nucleotide phosphotransferase
MPGRGSLSLGAMLGGVQVDFRAQFIVEPAAGVTLGDRDPGFTGDYEKKREAREALEGNVERLAELQRMLYAQNKHALLIVLQAMDAGGKDGTIRHVMSGVNPQGCRVTSFKVPSAEEADHDFLWRIHKAVPRKGEIGIFNRSQYEDIVAVRVRNLQPESVWSQRYDQINAFEKLLADNDVTILKFFLHISKDEQKERLLARIEEPDKHWKVNPGDWEDRTRWDDFVAAYEDVIARCSTKWAPWFVIPADRKWFRNLAVSQIILDTLEGLDMQYPPCRFDISQIETD